MQSFYKKISELWNFLGWATVKTQFDAIRIISFQLNSFPYAWFTVPPPKMIILNLGIHETARFCFNKLYTSRSPASWVTGKHKSQLDQSGSPTKTSWSPTQEMGGGSHFFHCWNHKHLCHSAMGDPWAVPRTHCIPVIRVLLPALCKVRQDFSLMKMPSNQGGLESRASPWQVGCCKTSHQLILILLRARGKWNH